MTNTSSPPGVVAVVDVEGGIEGLEGVLGGAGVVGEPIRELGEVEERRQIPWRSCGRVAACCGVACVEQRKGASCGCGGGRWRR